MELNQLPADYDAEKLGPQKRQTKFDSPEAKLAYDAKTLVVKARESLKEMGIENASNEQVVAAIKLIVGSHRKDFNKALPDTEQTLEAAVISKLYTKEEQARLAQAKAREGVRAKYETFIDGAKLTRSDVLKLKEMMSEVNYMLAVETARELKASKIPSYEQIVTELMTYTPARLRDICTMMEKPELVIESDQSFHDIVQAMDENSHYTAADGQLQDNTYVYGESNSPYRNLNKPGKVKASIVDGVVYPKQLERVFTRLGERRNHLTAKYADKEMKHISAKGQASLLQQSMKRAQAASDNSLIVDNWEKLAKENITGTITLLDPSELTESAFVAYSLFSSFYRQANFNASNPNFEDVYARGRASVQVLEI
ncbi:hypothetical protein HZA40_05580 [Candidatus Peregrinibacteria bacterium]|nr:hypothetical protein [Candidatus Peregrinibacteria bacterium]